MKRSMIGMGLIATLLAAAPAVAQDRPAIKVSGLVSATAFLQDQSFGFGNGQNAEWAASLENSTDIWFLGGDIRNTRFTVLLDGPEVLGRWKTGGVVEIDFFGQFNGTGAFSDEQPQPRLRLAYVDLTKGGTTVRIGQAWTPLFGFVPASVSHIAFPLGYGSAGMVGWRYPGIFLYQKLTGADAPIAAQLQLAAFRGSWVDDDGSDVLNNLSPGEASTVPQLEGRLDLSGQVSGIPWAGYVVGHIDRKDLSGVGAEAVEGEDDELTGTAFEVGARLTPGPLTVHGNAYWGRSIGQQFGHITQFGDISGWGGWAQAGYAFTPNWSAWLFAGFDDPEDEDLIVAIPENDHRLENTSLSAMLRYSEGPYTLGLEWLNSTTEWMIDDVQETRNANQFAFSVLYFF